MMAERSYRSEQRRIARTSETARKSVTCFLFALLSLNSSFAEEIAFDLDAQPMDKALLELAEEAHAQVAFSPQAAVRAENSPALRGNHSFEKAVELLLRDSSFGYRFISDDFVVVRPNEKERRVAQMSQNLNEATDYSTSLARLQRDTSTGMPPAEQESEKVGRSDGRDGRQERKIEEIVVTATKRRESSIHDLPMSITAIGSQDIERKGLVSMVDYLPVTPGVSMLDRGAGRSLIVMRGIAARPASDRNVGVYLGEVPIGSLAMFGSADIKLVDMERIELLRGPQGTLYGSSSMSGTVRTIPAAPKLSEYEGRLEVGYSYTAERGGNNNKIQGVFNVPVVEDKLGIRGVIYRHDESGFYENRAGSVALTRDIATSFGAPELAQNVGDMGGYEVVGGRMAALWQPSDTLSMTMTYVKQEFDQRGFPEEWPDIGKFQHARLQLVPFQLLDLLSSDGGPEGLADDAEITNLAVDYDIGWAAITSSTSWYEEKSTRNTELGLIFNAPVTQLQSQVADAFVQELRLSTEFEGPLQFVSGVYYEDIDLDRQITNHYSGDPELNPRTDVEFFTADRNINITQTALFGEATYDVTEQLAVTVGGRAFHYDRNESHELSGAIPGDPPPPISAFGSSESGESYKLNVGFTPNDNANFYAQWVEGFRLGRPQSALARPDCDTDNDGFIDGTSIPTGVSNIDSDYLDNYEIGSKFRSSNGDKTLNIAIYRINWEQMPIRVFIPCSGTATAERILNAGGARSQGAEVEASVYLMDDLRLDIGASYVDAELTEDALDLGEAGERLPGSPETNYNLGIHYDFYVGNYPAYIRGDWAYVGGYYNNFQEEGTEAGDYHIVNAKIGVALDQWSVNAFGKNLLNSDEYTWIQDIFGGRRAHRLRPRTVGIEFAYQF